MINSEATLTDNYQIIKFISCFYSRDYQKKWKRLP